MRIYLRWVALGLMVGFPFGARLFAADDLAITASGTDGSTSATDCQICPSAGGGYCPPEWKIVAGGKSNSCGRRPEVEMASSRSMGPRCWGLASASSAGSSRPAWDGWELRIAMAPEFERGTGTTINRSWIFGTLRCVGECRIFPPSIYGGSGSDPTCGLGLLEFSGQFWRPVRELERNRIIY